MRVYIYADGGESIGYGHLVRSGALGSEFLQSGHDVTYLTSTPTETKSIVPEACDIIDVSSPESITKSILKHNVKTLVTDSYEISHDLQREIADAVGYTVLLTDHAEHPVHCDMLINGNIFAESLDYDWTGLEPVMLLGSNYLIFRNHLRKYMEKNPICREDVQNILITMGGSDPETITPKAIESTEIANADIYVIVGPGFSDGLIRRIQQTAKDFPGEVHLINNPTDIGRYMHQADVAITTASTTVYELMGIGTPIICEPVIEHQQTIAKALKKQNLASVVSHDASIQEYRAAIKSYLDNAHLRKRRMESSRSIIDGLGAKRIVKNIESFAT